MIAVLLVLALWLDTPGLVQTAETVHAPTQFAHVNNTFRFEAAAPLARVAPLLGRKGSAAGRASTGIRNLFIRSRPEIWRGPFSRCGTGSITACG
jgi:hypothetical protein